MGLNVIHVYRLEPSDGKTIVRTDESVGGLPTRLFCKPIKRRMDTVIDVGPRSLKTEAERRAAA
jgi:hypothetical protein